MLLSVLKHVRDLWKDPEPPTLGASVGAVPGWEGLSVAGGKRGLGAGWYLLEKHKKGWAKPREESELGLMAP